MIKDRKRIKELMREMGTRQVSDVEMRETMFNEGLTRSEIMEILDELIREQLGTDDGHINEENIQLVMTEMIRAKMSAEKIWGYLEQFGIPPPKRVELMRQIKSRLQPQILICTMCGKNLSNLTKKDRKCPSCDYAMIKIFRDTKVKEGYLTKDEVISDLVSAKEFTEEEKDMIR